MGNETGLKLCPFCGSSRVKFYRVTGMYEAACSDCRCTTGIEGTKEAAAAAWNTRASGWIPCRERMPEDGQRVLICTGMRKMFVAEFDSTGNIFRQRIHQTCHTWYMEEVAHWMPLPEPPGGDDNA